MKSKRWLHLLSAGLMPALLLALLVGLTRAQEAAPDALGTAFTYQGQIKNEGVPYTGTCDLNFGLWDALSGGNQLANQTVAGVSVTDGLFTVRLDYGQTWFDGRARWLAIMVRCPAGGGAYTPLTPRQPLTATPYALYAARTGNAWLLAGNAGTAPGADYVGTTDDVALELRVNRARALRLEPNAASPNVIGGHGGNVVTAGVYGATIGGGGSGSSLNRVRDAFGTVGGGADNQAGDWGTLGDTAYATVGGGRSNAATAGAATVGGGTDNQAGGRWATVGGGWGNVAAADYATIGGGGRWDPGDPATANLVTDKYGTVGGGAANQAGDNAGSMEDRAYAVVAGGEGNTASGIYATVGGGHRNSATGGSATIGGGQYNIAGGQDSFVGAGSSNTATAPGATVGGGQGNAAGASGATVPGGLGAAASHFGEMAYASGAFDVAGDAQTSVYILRCAAATWCEMTLDNYGQRLTIGEDRTVVFDILIAARNSVGDSAGYRVRGIIENVAGVVSMVGTPVVETLAEDRPEWHINIGASSHALILEGENGGAVQPAMRWVAVVRSVELAY